jgi:hypothetical protein
VRNLLVVPSEFRGRLRAMGDNAKVNEEGEEKEEVKSYDDKARHSMEDDEESNDGCTRYRGG